MVSLTLSLIASSTKRLLVNFIGWQYIRIKGRDVEEDDRNSIHQTTTLLLDWWRVKDVYAIEVGVVETKEITRESPQCQPVDEDEGESPTPPVRDTVPEE